MTAAPSRPRQQHPGVQARSNGRGTRRSAGVDLAEEVVNIRHAPPPQSLDEIVDLHRRRDAPPVRELRGSRDDIGERLLAPDRPVEHVDGGGLDTGNPGRVAMISLDARMGSCSSDKIDAALLERGTEDEVMVDSDESRT